MTPALESWFSHLGMRNLFKHRVQGDQGQFAQKDASICPQPAEFRYLPPLALCHRMPGYRIILSSLRVSEVPALTLLPHSPSFACRDFRVPSVCCAVESPECSCLNGWKSLGLWKRLLHDGPVQCRLDVIFPVS